MGLLCGSLPVWIGVGFVLWINSANILCVRNTNSHQLVYSKYVLHYKVGVPEPALMWFSYRYYKPNQRYSWHSAFS